MIRSRHFENQLEEFYEKLLREPIDSFRRSLGEELQTVHRKLNQRKNENQSYEVIVEEFTFLAMYFASKVRALLVTHIQFENLSEAEKKNRWKVAAETCLYILHLTNDLLEEDEFTGTSEDVRECHLVDETENGRNYEHWATVLHNREDDIIIVSDSEEEMQFPTIEQ